MILVENLCKYYGSHCALNNISFSVEQTGVVGFLGPNGAGKTTTMNIMTGYLSSTSGNVLVDGYNILEEPAEVKKRIGYLPEIPPLYLDMKVFEYLDFVFGLKKLKCKFDKVEHILEICKLVRIDDVMDRLIKNLSKGYKQRVGLAQAMLGNPEILILDEPTVGLDPQQIIEVRDLIKHLGETHTIIFSSHILSEVQAMCDRIIVINNGEIVADGNADEIANSVNDNRRFVVTVEGDAKTTYEGLCEIGNIKDIRVVNNPDDESFCTYVIETDVDIRRDISKKIAELGFVMLELKTSDVSLEELFCKIIESGENSEVEKISSEKSVGNSDTEVFDTDETEGTFESEGDKKC